MGLESRVASHRDYMEFEVASFVRDWQIMSQRRSRKGRMSSSRANSSAAPTSARTARARSRRRPRSRLGPSALTSCESSTAANPSRRRPPLPRLLRDKLPNHPRRFITSVSDTSGPPTSSEGPFVRLGFRPPLAPHRSAQGIQREAEVAFGQRALERQQDGSATTPVRKHHHRARPTPPRSRGSLGAYAASCSCLPAKLPL